MAGHVMFCKKCRDEMEEPFFGYYAFSDKGATCRKHGDPMKLMLITNEEYLDIIDIAPRDTSFLEAMIDLKQKDPIEFQLKMSQFKATQPQAKVVEEDNVPKCPTCNSTNIQKIGGLERAGSVAMFGLFSKKINKSFKCGNCGHTW